MVTVQGPLPVHAPDQLVKTDPVIGVAFNVTGVLAEKEAEQVAPQSMLEAAMAIEIWLQAARAAATIRDTIKFLVVFFVFSIVFKFNIYFIY